VVLIECLEIEGSKKSFTSNEIRATVYSIATKPNKIIQENFMETIWKKLTVRRPRQRREKSDYDP
jgi:hypothetical protein